MACSPDPASSGCSSFRSTIWSRQKLTLGSCLHLEIKAKSLTGQRVAEGSAQRTFPMRLDGKIVHCFLIENSSLQKSAPETESQNLKESPGSHVRCRKMSKITALVLTFFLTHSFKEKNFPLSFDQVGGNLRRTTSGQKVISWPFCKEMRRKVN